MNYLRGALSAASQYYKDINPSTLTGAIDVIVVRRTTDSGDQILACSPFHVRFGKLQVLRPADKKVDVSVNGQQIPYYMKIGDAGEAFFVFETEGDVPEDLITSPLLEATKSEAEGGEPIAVGRFGAKDDHEEDTLSSEGRGSLEEPEPFDLNGSAAEPEVTTPRQSNLSLTKPSESSPTMEELSEKDSTNFLDRTAEFTKAVYRAAVETERDQRAQMADRIEGAKNVAANAYDRLESYTSPWGVASDDSSQKDRGDQALPPMKEGEGEPPEVVYTNGVALDMAGYHADGKSKRHSLHSRSTDDLVTPRSRSPSTVVTPGTSRSSSPDRPIGGITAQRPQAMSNARAKSESPESSPVNSPPAYSWEWGAFPQPSPMKTSFSGIVESHEVQRSLSVPPEIGEPHGHLLEASSISSTPSTPPTPPTIDSLVLSDDAELTADENDGRRFLITIGNCIYDFELSICDPPPIGLTDVDGIRRFAAGGVSFRRFIKYPAVVREPGLVIRWDDQYISRKDDSPLFDALPRWREAAMAKPSHAQALEEEPLSSSDERDVKPSERTPQKKATSSWVRWWRSSRNDVEAGHVNAASLSTPALRKSTERRRPSLVPTSSAPPEAESLKIDTTPPINVNGTTDSHEKRFAKTLRLTSDQLKELDLKPGPNSVTFSLSASGTIAATARIFLWEAIDKIVVSDIDGTITKSDALGHMFTMIGRDWTHVGVAKLYTDICRNGYKIMYLTSRAIGQADSTRDYLKGINQNNYQLPEGPVVMSPDRLIASLHREVIMRKPEVFKMACLRDIQRLFGEGAHPFYAGFGNRITDAMSYRSVNIPSERIFTIDSSGEVKMELLEVAGYKSSYIHLTDLVDQMFPPINQTSAPEFTDFNFWKPPIPDISLPELTPPSPTLSARSDTSSTFSRIRNFSLGRQNTKQYALPPPAIQSSSRSGSRATSHERGFSIRSMTSLEKLGFLLPNNSDDGAEESTTPTYIGSSASSVDFPALSDYEMDHERKARKRLSRESMPGSLPGSLDTHVDFDEAEEEKDSEEDEEYDGENPEEDPEEAAEEGFDEDFLATDEMENVPFL